MGQNLNTELSRMKNLMNFGMVNESRTNNYNTLEHYTEGADGKLYGIVKEGTKYYIKQASKPKNGGKIIAEKFDYIGGWMNRKKNEYASYVDTLKNFDLKMMSLAEANNKSGQIITESLNPDKKLDNQIKGTSSMQREINRQREIMSNASIISEGSMKKAKPISEKKVNECDCTNGKPCVGTGCECGDAKKANKTAKGKKEKDMYKPAKQNPFDKDGNPVNEEVLGFNRDDDNYMDTTHGTEIGSGKPFDKKANDGKDNHAGHQSDESQVNEDASVKEPNFKGYREFDKGLPDKACVGEVGNGKPFDKKVNESMDEEDEIDDIITDDDDFGADTDDTDDDAIDTDDTDDDSIDIDDDEDGDIDIDIDDDEDFDENDMNSKLDDIISRLDSLENKIGEQEFSDDSLYPDDDESEDDDDETDNEEDTDDEPMEFEISDDNDNDDYDDNTNESRTHRRGKRINEDRLNVFGKHPAYRKKVMTLPNHRHNEMPGYRDWNDESAETDAPYGEKIGSGKPFSINPESIDNAISEAINRRLKKK